MNERRRANRVDFDGEATLVFQQGSYPVSLDDISIMGARLNSTPPLALPDAAPVTLTITLEDSDITLTLPAKVKRQEGHDIGIMFDRPSVDDMQHLRRIVMLHQGDDGEDDPATLLPPES
ncbi:PilZ domain-containing protein [Alcanivorax sp.]|uniref:PilZ domain-containing protein n=1 Tax=Alcanivorax sp. TaxID=1872427 RepID=UPI003A94615C